VNLARHWDLIWSNVLPWRTEVSDILFAVGMCDTMVRGIHPAGLTNRKGPLAGTVGWRNCGLFSYRYMAGQHRGKTLDSV